ncbi:MAG: ABC transporter permease [Dehalococcoidales bacterium]
MNWGIVRALVSKDLALFFRNRFFSIVTVLGLVFYLIFYFVMPSSVDESLAIGFYAPEILPAIEEAFQEGVEEGLKVTFTVTEEALKEGVIGGDFITGIVLPADTAEALISGERPVITLYFSSDIPEEAKEAAVVTIRELVYRQVGQELPVEIKQEVLGPDMLGMQVPPRDRLRPLLAVFLIIFETLGLANLISEEVERGTIQALLVTPVRVRDLFISKGIVGITLAFGQAVIFMAIVGGLSREPLLILVTLFLGAALATGIAFLIASLGKDFMSVMAWGMLIFIILAIPAFGVMFPGAVTGWIKIVPSYYLVDTVHRVSNFGAGWLDMWNNLVILLGIDFVLFWVVIQALRRKAG